MLSFSFNFLSQQFFIANLNQRWAKMLLRCLKYLIGRYLLFQFSEHAFLNGMHILSSHMYSKNICSPATLFIVFINNVAVIHIL